jgi:hypothetical protein
MTKIEALAYIAAQAGKPWYHDLVATDTGAGVWEVVDVTECMNTEEYLDFLLEAGR